MVPVSRAVAMPVTPAGGAAIGRAAPQHAGSSHSAGLPWPMSSFPSGPLGGGLGRLEANSSEPSARNSGAPSPSALRVSRAGGPLRPAVLFGLALCTPATGIRQILVTYFFGSPPTVCTAAASQDPSGDSRSAVTRGIAT